MPKGAPDFGLELRDMSEIDLSSALRRLDFIDAGHSETWSVGETGSTAQITQQEDLDFQLRHLSRNDLDLRLKRFSDIYTGQALPWVADNTGFTSQPTREENEEATINSDEDDGVQYVAGFALYALVAGLTMASFLLMIDSTILVTVSLPYV